MTTVLAFLIVDVEIICEMAVRDNEKMAGAGRMAVKCGKPVFTFDHDAATGLGAAESAAAALVLFVIDNVLKFNELLNRRCSA